MLLQALELISHFLCSFFSSLWRFTV